MPEPADTTEVREVEILQASLALTGGTEDGLRVRRLYRRRPN